MSPERVRFIEPEDAPGPAAFLANPPHSLSFAEACAISAKWGAELATFLGFPPPPDADDDDVRPDFVRGPQ